MFKFLVSRFYKNFNNREYWFGMPPVTYFIQSIHEESPKQYKVKNYTIVSISRLDYRLEVANKQYQIL